MRDSVDRLERRMARRMHWYRVCNVFGLLAVGAMVLWSLIEVLIFTWGKL